MAKDARRLRVLAAPAGDAQNPSSFARVHQHLDRLRRQGLRVEVTRPHEEPWRWFERVLRGAASADVVWVQNVLLPPRLLRVLARASRRLVIDVDEPIGGPPQAPLGDEDAERLQRLRTACEVADLTIVDRLVSLDGIGEGAAGRIRTVPTGVPAERARPASRPRLVLGWPGALGLPVAALAPLVEAVSHPALADRVELRLLAGAADDEIEALAARRPNVRVERVRGAGLAPFQRVLDEVDLACLPLGACPWAGGVSALALTLPHSRGVPVVVSGRPAGAALGRRAPVLRIIEPRSWREGLEAVLANPADLAVAGRRAIVSARLHSSVEQAFGALALALTLAATRPIARRAAPPLFRRVSPAPA